MEDKTKIETTPKSIYQHPLENKRKIKTAQTTNNTMENKSKIETTPTSIYQWPFENNRKI